MTVAHSLSKFLPRTLSRRVQPWWHLAREAAIVRFRQGGRIRRARDLGVWTASRPFGSNRRQMRVAVRSYKELRRLMQLGSKPGDPVFRWLHEIKDCTVLYDVGSANGLEGFLAHHLQKCKVVFVEPFTPSIETILCTVYLQASRDGVDRTAFEIVHAGCSDAPGFHRAYYHELPKPGATYVSFADVDAYCRGGRSHEPVYATQWTPGVSLDYLAYECGLPPPSHVKIDVDGFETRVMRGAKLLLAERVARSWVIEVTGEGNIAEIDAVMATHGYRKSAEFEHYPGYEFRTFDFVYDRA